MEIKKINVGCLETNCYILIKENKCLLVDPGSDYKKIVLEINNNQLVGILLTHNHFDHIGALNELLNSYDVNSYDYHNLKEGINKIDIFKFEVIQTPGHTNDSITYYFNEENIMFTGDFLFKETVGRWDLDTGNYNNMLTSINKIKKYNENIIVYPGHGDSTSIKYEIKNNPFFNTK